MADASQITTVKSRPRLGMSAQAKYARLQQAKGNCRICGKDRRTPEEIAAGLPAKLKQNCRLCQDKATAYMRRYRASRKLKLQGDQPEIKAEKKENSNDQRNDAASI